MLVLSVIVGCGKPTVADNGKPTAAPQRDDRTDEMLVAEALDGPGGEAAATILAQRTTIDPANPTRDHLRTVFRESDQAPIRIAAIQGVAKGWDYNAMDDLLAALDDESLEVRASAGVAVNQLLGLRFYYCADDPPEKRAKVVAQMRNAWSSMQGTGRLDHWLKRLPEVHEQLSLRGSKGKGGSLKGATDRQ